MAAVVVDYTSSECRAGLAGGDGPTSVFPCLVARSPGDPETVFVGKEALSKRQGVLMCTCRHNSLRIRMDPCIYLLCKMLALLSRYN